MAALRHRTTGRPNYDPHLIAGLQTSRIYCVFGEGGLTASLTAQEESLKSAIREAMENIDRDAVAKAYSSFRSRLD